MYLDMLCLMKTHYPMCFQVNLRLKLMSHHILLHLLNHSLNYRYMIIIIRRKYKLMRLKWIRLQFQIQDKLSGEKQVARASPFNCGLLNPNFSMTNCAVNRDTNSMKRKKQEGRRRSRKEEEEMKKQSKKNQNRIVLYFQSVKTCLFTSVYIYTQ